MSRIIILRKEVVDTWWYGLTRERQFELCSKSYPLSIFYLPDIHEEKRRQLYLDNVKCNFNDVKALFSSNESVFEKECNELLELGYRLSSSSCGYQNSHEPFFTAIFIRENNE